MLYPIRFRLRQGFDRTGRSLREILKQVQDDYKKITLQLRMRHHVLILRTQIGTNLYLPRAHQLLARGAAGVRIFFETISAANKMVVTLGIQTVDVIIC